VVVLTGSLPASTPLTFYRDLLETTTARAVLDVRGPELLAALPCRPWLVKPNREELALTLGYALSNDRELTAAMQEINRRGAAWVVVTQGSAAVWATTVDETYRLEPPATPVVNPIGCGDAMCAGIAWSIDHGDDRDALRTGRRRRRESIIMPPQYSVHGVRPAFR
jgi:fructose-1-phosphate kinase PfkB-like protein